MPHKDVEARREYHRRYREKHRDKLLDADREYRKRTYGTRKAVAAKYRKEHYAQIRENQRQYGQGEHGKEIHNRSSSLWSKRNLEKKRAYAAVRRALKSGKLHRQPCEECGDPKVHAHHDDYLKPLNIRWLCVSHHEKAHHQQTFCK